MRRTHLYALLSVVLCAVVLALRQGADVQSGRFAISAGSSLFVLPVTLYLWCKVDATTRSVTPPPGAIPLLAVLAPVGWIYYLLGTRRPLQALTTIFAVIVVLFVIATGVHALLISRAATAT